MRQILFIAILFNANIATTSFATTNCQMDAEKAIAKKNVTIEKSREVYTPLHPKSAVDRELYLVYTKERINFVAIFLPKYEEGIFTGSCKAEYLGSFRAMVDPNPKLECRGAAEQAIKAKKRADVLFSREVFQELHPGIVAEREMYVVYASEPTNDIDYVVVVKVAGEAGEKCKVEYAMQFGDPSVHP